jgi:hypothetical protein
MAARMAPQTWIRTGPADEVAAAGRMERVTA